MKVYTLRVSTAHYPGSHGIPVLALLGHKQFTCLRVLILVALPLFPELTSTARAIPGHPSSRRARPHNSLRVSTAIAYGVALVAVLSTLLRAFLQSPLLRVRPLTLAALAPLQAALRHLDLLFQRHLIFLLIRLRSSLRRPQAILHVKSRRVPSI